MATETGNKTVLRNGIADFLNVGKDSTDKYAFMGMGFNTLDENPNAQIDTKAYISDKSASNIIKGYQPQYPFDSDLIESEEAIMELYLIGRNRLQGMDAERDYVRVDLFMGELEANTYPARKSRVAVEVSGVTGGGAEVIHVAGNLNNVGDFIDGKFNIDTKVFTAIESAEIATTEPIVSEE